MVRHLIQRPAGCLLLQVALAACGVTSPADSPDAPAHADVVRADTVDAVDGSAKTACDDDTPIEPRHNPDDNANVRFGEPTDDGPTAAANRFAFRDVTTDAGVSWAAYAPAGLPAAGAFADIDGDGDDDLILATYSAGATSSRLRLYSNVSSRSTIAFVDVTTAAGLGAFTVPTTGVYAADADNDGDQDLYLTSFGDNVLLQNAGAGAFSPVTYAAGVADPHWSTSAAFSDYDGDGDLDLYVGNYIGQSNYPNHTGQPNTLYRNEGDGTYVDVTREAGVGGAGTTLAVTWADIDNDGDPDLIVCNDHGAAVEANLLYRNDGAAGENRVHAGQRGVRHRVLLHGGGGGRHGPRR